MCIMVNFPKCPATSGFICMRQLTSIVVQMVSRSVADPGFPRGGAPTLQGRQHAVLLNFPNNCMKLKEFGRGGARPKFYYVDPPL